MRCHLQPVPPAADEPVPTKRERKEMRVHARCRENLHLSFDFSGIFSEMSEKYSQIRLSWKPKEKQLQEKEEYFEICFFLYAFKS